MFNQVNHPAQEGVIWLIRFSSRGYASTDCTSDNVATIAIERVAGYKTGFGATLVCYE